MAVANEAAEKSIMQAAQAACGEARKTAWDQSEEP